MSDVISGGRLATCPQCLTSYPYRKGKTYCTAKCRIYASRPKQNSHKSPTKLRRNTELFDNAKSMAVTMYSLPPFERLGYIKELIDEARAGNTQLREILSNHKLLHPDPFDDAWLFYRRSRSYCTIAQAADNYCKRYWRANVSDVVYCRCEEPETGEVP